MQSENVFAQLAGITSTDIEPHDRPEEQIHRRRDAFHATGENAIAEGTHQCARDIIHLQPERGEVEGQKLRNGCPRLAVADPSA